MSDSIAGRPIEHTSFDRKFIGPSSQILWCIIAGTGDHTDFATCCNPSAVRVPRARNPYLIVTTQLRTRAAGNLLYVAPVRNGFVPALRRQVQLERGIAEILKALEANPKKVPPRPADPV